jgi:uncharacterized protein (TIRG00374 family)
MEEFKSSTSYEQLGQPDPFADSGSAMDEEGLGRFFTPRAVVFIVLGITAAILGLYVLLPKLVGVNDAINRIGSATWYWVAIAPAFTVVSFLAYAMVFRAVVGGGDNPKMRERLNLRASVEIVMAGFAGNTLFSAGGAGGLVVVYWALRKARMEPRRAACRMVALLVILYSFYALSLIVFGILLRTGVLSGDSPVGGTIVPAAVAGVLIVVFLLIALIPGDFERRLTTVQTSNTRGAKVARRLATIPATVATGVRTAIDRLRDPRTRWLAALGGIFYWGGNIGVLWAAFHAYGIHVPFGVVVMGFFVGMTANLIPSPAAGVGPVDAGMIAAFLLFGLPKDSVFPAVLTYRLVAFWLPLIPGIIAYLKLRQRVRRWELEDRGGYTSVSKVLETS